MRAITTIAILLLGLCAAAAQTAAQREACEADFRKFCEGVTPGGGRIIECLEQHKEQLSSACQQVVENAK